MTDSAPPESGKAASDADGSAGSLSEADLATILEMLTQAVRRYGVEQQRVPANLEELVDRGYLTRVPAAPRGRRYVIDRQLRVQLQDE